MSLLQAVGLSKEFQRRTAGRCVPFNAISGINLSINEGDFLTITGKSGSGKTTLLTLLAGLASPTSGSVLFKGQDIHALPDKKLSLLRNHEIGFIPQGMGLLGNLTVFDNVRASQMFAGNGGSDSSRADFLLEELGLRDLALEYPKNLSGGEIRRVSVARALFNEPSVLLADEPTSDLDPENTRAVLSLLSSINKQGTAVVVATHEQEVSLYGNLRYSMESLC